MKIFIAGSKGQLGYDCLQVLQGKHELLGLDLPDLDITSADSVERVLGAFRPDVTINCAAYTKVDAAETQRDLARRVNVDGPANLARFAERSGGFLVHISTDYVFDGQRQPPRPYVESDVTGPQCYYGVTKLEGEQAVQAATQRHAILRTAWLYGINGANFLKTMLRLAVRAPGKPIRVVNDQFGSATGSWRLAQQIEKVFAAGASGLFHATAEGFGTWWEVAGHFLEAMDVPHQVVPITTAEYPTPARRPANSILENVRLKELGINVMADWKADVTEFANTHRARLLADAAPV
jgi:dTDP-4-dehydrorhamnose reductase